MTPGFRDPRFDLSRIAAGTLVAASAGAGLGFGLLQLATSQDSRPGVGPTAASLNEGFSALLGAGIGLLLGSAFASAAVRRGSRMVSGVVSGSLALGFVFIPVDFFTRPSDIGAGEGIGLTAGLAAFLEIPVLSGALIGSSMSATAGLVGVLRRRGRS